MDKIEQSKAVTKQHQAEVKMIMLKIGKKIADRSETHDNSKLMSPEIEVFAEHTPALVKLNYDSEEYKAQLADMKMALDHHYANNRHHPEHFPNKLAGMNLIDLVELLADWKASSLRQNDGNLLISIQKNQKRFGYTDELASILKNTAELLELL